MILQPIPEHKAQGDVKKYYEELKKALDTQNLPVFFQYLGPFPEFLGYISSQILRNLISDQFRNLVDNLYFNFKKTIPQKLIRSKLITDWLKNYKNLPEFYHFQNDLENIFKVNIKMSFIFLSIREAVKGWAVASKKLAGETGANQKKSEYNKENNKLIFEVTDDIMQSFVENGKSESGIVQSTASLSVRPERGLVKNLLPDYLNASKLDFDRIMHTESYVFFRVETEKTFLNNLDSMPDLIFCPINVVLGLTKKYDNYPELLYLLSEHFPTFVVQRMIFSGYLLF